MYRRLPGVLAALSLAALAGGCAQPGPVRVMSLNTHAAPAATDGDDWALLQTEVLDAIRSGKPDIAGLQEVEPAHVAGLLAALPEYAVIAIAKSENTSAVDALPILYRKDHFTLAESGQFWLSPSPQQPGSVGWDAKQPRVVVWARLRCKDAPLTEVQVVNVRFDEDGRQARLESAELLRRLVESAGTRPLVVLGEFACPAGSRPYQILTEDRLNLAALTDAHGHAAQRGALQALTGGGGGRSQWILMNRRLQAIRAEGGENLGRWSSLLETTPVAATLQLARAASGYT